MITPSSDISNNIFTVYFHRQKSLFQVLQKSIKLKVPQIDNAIFSKMDIMAYSLNVQIAVNGRNSAVF